MSPRARQRDRTLPEGVFKRGDSYIFRKAIPPELRPRIGRREVFKSLGTSDETEARVLGAVELVLSERLFHEARESLALDQAAAGLWRRDEATGGTIEARQGTVDALTRLMETEQDATRRSILGPLLSRFYFPRPTHNHAEQTMTELLAHWEEVEHPPASELEAVTTAVRRFLEVVGDIRAADAGMTALRRFEGALPATDRDSVVKALQGLLLWFREPSPDSHGDMTISALLDMWNEAERPSVPEFHVVGVAVDRFVKAVGDRRLADVTPTALEEFEQALATTPYQKQGQPLHKAGREATVGAIQRLLRWRDEGGPERAAHAAELGRAIEEE